MTMMTMAMTMALMGMTKLAAQTAILNSPPPDNSSPHGGTGVAPGDVTPPSTCGSNKGSSKCPPPPRKPADEQEEEAIPSNHCKMSWAAYKIADKHPYSTTFERFATSEHSHSIIELEMLYAFSIH
jgi:hypothetical protein